MHLSWLHPIHFRKVGIGPFGHDRLPCATGLASYPISYVFFLTRTITLFGASRSSDLIAIPRSSLAFQRLLIGSLNPRQSVPFSRSGCDTGPIRRLILFVQNRRIADHHTGSQ
jgi:hypothetical protein